MTLTTPFQGRFFIDRVGLATVNIFINFEVSTCTCYEAMNGCAKCRKLGVYGALEVVCNVTIR